MNRNEPQKKPCRVSHSDSVSTYLCLQIVSRSPHTVKRIFFFLLLIRVFARPKDKILFLRIYHNLGKSGIKCVLNRREGGENEEADDDEESLVSFRIYILIENERFISFLCIY